MKSKLFLFLVLFAGQLHAQKQGQDLIDSLHSVEPAVVSDTGRLQLFIRLSDTYKSINPTKGIEYANKALALSQEKDRVRGKALAYKCLGMNYQYKAEYAAALKYYRLALDLVDKTPQDIGFYWSIISHIAVVYQEMGDYEKALEYHHRALEIDKQIDDQVNVGGDYGNMGIIYQEMKEYDKALEMDMQSLAVFQKINDKDGVAHNMGNIGNIYLAKGQYQKALEYDRQALDLFRELGDLRSLAINYGNIGEVYYTMATEARLGTHDYTARNMHLERAARYLDTAVRMSEGLGEMENIIEFSDYLSKVYEARGDYPAALALYKKYVLAKDSVYSLDNTYRIKTLQNEAELALKEKQVQIDKLELETKRNERFILIAALAAALLLLIYLIRVIAKQISRNRTLAEEKRKHLEHIQQQRSVLNELAHAQAHEVNGKVSTILGLTALFNKEDYTDPDNKTIIDGVDETATQLDSIVKEMIKKENRLHKQ